MCNLSDLVEMRGIEKGIEKGKIEGKIEAKKEVVLKMLIDGLSYKTISKYSDVPLQIIKEWEPEL